MSPANISRWSAALRGTALCSLLAASLFAGGCAPKVPPVQNLAGEVEDTAVFSQSLAFFARKAGGTQALRSAEAAERDFARFRQHFFAPWSRESAGERSVKDFRDMLGRREGRGFAENRRPWTDEAWEAMRRNAGLDAPDAVKALRHAVTVRPCDLRLAPTERPRFASMEGAGQGWPFDSFQQSAMPAGLPLMVHHVSRDGAWYLAECPYAWGWVRAEDVAFAGEDLRALWQKTPLGAFVRDGVPLRFGSDGAFLARADIGTVLPMPSSGTVLLPVRRADGSAAVLAVRLPAGLSSSAVPMPQELSAHAVAAIGDRMMGRPYGWGGMYGDRDCSSMMRDLFAPFGLWLPRNSAAQAKSGRMDALEGPAAAKEQAMLEKGLPFRTLLWMPGHVGLYVGDHEGKPAFFHNIWGVRSRLSDGRDGRVILGRAVVSGVRPGAERSDVEPEALLIERMRGMAHIVEDDGKR